MARNRSFTFVELQTSQPHPIMARLIHERGSLAGSAVELSRTTIAIGRGPDNDVIVEDPTLSVRHCRIAFDFRRSKARVRQEPSGRKRVVNRVLQADASLWWAGLGLSQLWDLGPTCLKWVRRRRTSLTGEEMGSRSGARPAGSRQFWILPIPSRRTRSAIAPSFPWRGPMRICDTTGGVLPGAYAWSAFASANGPSFFTDTSPSAVLVPVFTDGTLTVVPEPGSCALTAGVLLLGFGLWRQGFRVS